MALLSANVYSFSTVFPLALIAVSILFFTVMRYYLTSTLCRTTGTEECRPSDVSYRAFLTKRTLTYTVFLAPYFYILSAVAAL